MVMPAEEDLPPEKPYSTIFTAYDCGCVVYVTRSDERPTPNGTIVITKVQDILHRCELHDFLRYELHNNSITKELEHYTKLVQYYDQQE
jgi:hypothetical protein